LSTTSGAGGVNNLPVNFAAYQAVRRLVVNHNTQSLDSVLGKRQSVSNASKPMTPPINKRICGLPVTGSCPTNARTANKTEQELVNPTDPLTKTRFVFLLMREVA